MDTPAGTVPVPSSPEGATQGRSGQLGLIRTLLSQTPEQRLAGLRQAAAFFQSARRA